MTTSRTFLARTALVAGAALLAVACSSETPSTGSAPATGDAEGVALASAAVGGSADGALAAGITATGTGRVTGQPDTLRATVGVEVRRDRVDDALTAANDAAQQVIDTLTGEGVAEQDIQTVDVSVRPEYGDQTDGSQPRITGYVATNLLQVRLSDLAGAGAVLDTAVRAAGDAARLQGVSFSLEDNQELVRAARERAFADARTTAEQYAELAGVELGGLVSVAEISSAPPPAADVATEAFAGDSAVPIQPGQQQVSVSVTTVWSFG